MALGSKLEVHFHEQDVVSMFFESDAQSENEEKICEVIFFTMFALRQLSNLGKHESAGRLAAVLIRSATTIEKLAAGEARLDFQLVPYPGYKGRKQFIGRLTLSDSFPVFQMDAKGFGFLATGVGYYAPISVVAAMAYLARKRKQDAEYLQVLGQSAAYCGGYYDEGQITTGNQQMLAMNIVGSTCECYMQP